MTTEKTSLQTTALTSARGVLVVAVVAHSTVVVGHYWSVHPSGSDALLAFTDLLVLPLAVALLFFPAGILFLPFKRTRRDAVQLIVLTGVWLTVGVFSFWAGNAIRMNALEAFTRRCAPLVQAIKAHEREHGAPPETLAGLVPERLPALPTTGMNAYASYHYRRSPDTGSYGGNPWRLWLDAPSGFLNFDELLYLPKENYGDVPGLDPLPVGNWAYLLE